MLVWRKRNIEKKLSLCYSSEYRPTIIMVHKGTSSSYRSVDRRALILLGLALCLLSASVSSVFMVLYIYILIFLHTSFFLPFNELSLVGYWPLIGPRRSGHLCRVADNTV